MSSTGLPSFVKEELNLLEPAWMAGGRRILKSTKSVKQQKIDKSIEIKAVDIVASCKKVQDLMRSSNGLRRRQLLAQSSSTNDSIKCNQIISFRDITRLSFGLSNIFSQQVDNLLGDTENLLNQMKSFGNIFDIPDQPSATQKRKRKLIVKEQTRVTTTKKICFQKTEASHDNYRPNEYGNMLTECLEWNNIELSTEFSRMCQNTNTTEQNITLKGVIYNKDPTLFPEENEGFGDPTPDDINFINNIIEDLFPNTSLKRPAQVNQSDILCHKRSRFDTTLEQAVTDNGISDDNIQVPSDCEMSTHQELIPEVLISPARQGKLRKKKKKRISKFIIDECIKYSRQCLLEHRVHYRDQFEAKCLTRPKITKVIQTAKQLLNCTKCDKIKHKHLEKITILTKHKMDNEEEYTLRAIFGSDYNENIAKEIYQNPSTSILQLSQETLLPILPSSNHEEEPAQLIPFTVLPASQISIPEDRSFDNNNNINEKNNENIDPAFGIMTFLLETWHYNPDKKIDAHQLMETCQNSKQVAVCFYILLDLVRDTYIKITKKKNTLEMNKILIGSESIRFLKEISQDDKTF